MSGIHDDQGARVRAARGWADLTQGTLARRIGIGREAVIAIEANQRELSVPELLEVAEVCGVPASFLLSGWAAPEGLEDRVSALEDALSLSRQDRDEIARQLVELSVELETARAMSAKQVLELTQWLQSIEDRLDEAGGPTP